MTSVAAAAGLGLLFVRPGMLVMGTPFLGALNAPATVRVGLTVLIGLAMAPLVTLPPILGAGALALVVLREVAIGMVLAFAVRLVVVGAECAGQLAGYQVGLSLGALIDPQSGVRNNILAVLYANLTVVLCFASNVHHTMLKALADSYVFLPVGLGGLNTALAPAVGAMLGTVLVFAVRLAAPLMAILLVVELALGLLGRVAPSLHLLVAGAPIRVVLGLLVLAATLAALPELIARYVPTVLQLGTDTAKAFR